MDHICIHEILALLPILNGIHICPQEIQLIVNLFPAISEYSGQIYSVWGRFFGKHDGCCPA